MDAFDKSIQIIDPPMSARQIHAAIGRVISLRQIYRAWERGELRCSRVGGRRLARLSWVQRWLDGKQAA